MWGRGIDQGENGLMRGGDREGGGLDYRGRHATVRLRSEIGVMAMKESLDFYLGGRGLLRRRGDLRDA